MPECINVNRRRALLTAAAAALLVACTGPTEVAGIQGSGAPSATAGVGTITGFGSIFLGGVEYSTSGAQIQVDGQPATEAQLHSGQVVTIQGSVTADGATGTANDVSYSGDLQGPISQPDLLAKTFAILGQKVRVTSATMFDPAVQPADLTGLHAGTILEVSGFADAAGSIRATRLDLKPTGAPFQVKGTVAGLDSAAGTFRLNSLVVNYNAAISSSPLANGTAVLVQAAAVNASGQLQAMHIAVLPGLGATANQKALLQGIITTFASGASFVLQGQQVTTDAQTQRVLHGVVLGANVEVEVQGTFNSAGAVLASKVEVRPNSTSLVRGLVDSVAATGGTLSVVGVKVTTSTATEYEDKSSLHVRRFHLADLHVGDYVEVDGAEGPPGTVSAAVLSRYNGDNHSQLQGVALNVTNPTLAVLGVNVVTSPQTRFFGPGGTASGAAAFFSQAANHIVRVHGSFAAGVLSADQAQIEQ